MSQKLHDTAVQIGISSVIALIFVGVASFLLWRRDLWLRLLDAEESFWLRFGFPNGGLGRRFSESRFVTFLMVFLALGFLLLTLANGYLYLRVKYHH
jgi:hypothetical protein